MSQRKALFISHATPEDNDFALWLGTKLSAMGYEVWADVLKLRGGDDWARKLEDALRNRAQKVLFVANPISVSKQGVRNEIQIATEVGKKTDDSEFIIPLRLSNYDAPFLIAHAQYIDFKRSWSHGLIELLETLDEYRVPKVQAAATRVGLQNWRQAHLHKARHIERRDETLISNWLAIRSLTETIRLFDFRGGIEIISKDRAVRDASIPLVANGRGFIGFASQQEYQEMFGENLPLKLIGEHSLSEFLQFGWSGQDIKKADARRHIVNLVRQALEIHLRAKKLDAMRMADNHLAWWWHKGDTNDGQISFSWEHGPAGRRQIIGFLPKSNLYWHFGLTFYVSLAPMPHLQLMSRVIFSEDGKTPFGKSAYMFQLRRSKTKNWRNPRWRDMMLAFLHHLSNGEAEFEIPFCRDSSMSVALPPMMFEAPVTVSEIDIPDRERTEDDGSDFDYWEGDSDDSLPGEEES